MGWREVIHTTIFGYAGTNDERTGVIADAIESRLLDMLETDRIALARELLAGTGRVVARDVGTMAPMLAPVDSATTPVTDWQRGWADGHNACRAAMLKEDES